jgi:hypothetical protein
VGSGFIAFLFLYNLTSAWLMKSPTNVLYITKDIKEFFMKAKLKSWF